MAKDLEIVNCGRRSRDLDGISGERIEGGRGMIDFVDSVEVGGMRARFIFASLVIILLVGFSFTPAIAQKSAASTPISNSPGAGAVDPSLYSAMRWRLLGPHRAGRVSAVAGIAG